MPKLCLENCSSSEDEPVYTVASGGNYSTRSDSTVSWGTESSENSSRNLHIRPAVYPPWATHLPLVKFHFDNQLRRTLPLIAQRITEL